ncbi:MAG: peptidoglycan endopeptidase [Rhodocyclaceae bacterium]|nr:MAG: peptidoglycan endopeptidase [Rhodocyclaceae bacterium]
MIHHAVSISVLLMLAGCGTMPATTSSIPSPRQTQNIAVAPEKGSNIVLYALGLIDAGYRYGGKNPSAGLDCSGMVSHIFEQAAGLRITGSAADIARKGKPVDLSKLRPGDLVFFNTRNRPHSHVGIFIGDGRFVHAPNSQGKVRTESLTQGWFAARLEEARTYFD